MTTLTAPPTADTSLRPLPWRRMAWVTWRQHRIALGGMAVFLGAFAVYLWLSGLGMHHAYATDCKQAGSLGCNMILTGNYGVTTIYVGILAQTVPALIGAFIGAPVLARELETGTYRYAFTQSIGRRRWTLGKLVPLAVIVTAAAGAFSALYSWYNQPLYDVGYTTPFDARLFNLNGIAFAAWTLTAFTIGVLAGMLTRRVVPAIAATLAAYAALAATTGFYLRQHYITPLVTNALNPPGSGWIVSQWYTKSGQYAFPNRGSKIVDAVNQLCPPAQIRSDRSLAVSISSPAQCLTQHGYMHWTSYQPASRFWPFQIIESGWLLALSVLLIAVTMWLVRRRAI
jgi:ABC-type transport system involved in multi-copper enzyme maturation permease subunit